ncbi:MAG: large conductance mechanosensitive channel protein MscL [Chthoniobacterales bacterium]
MSDTKKSLLQEFKEFAVKGNAVDLAIGVVIGAAFATVVSSLVKDVIMPPIGLAMGGIDFSNMYWLLKAGKDGATNYPTVKAAQEAGAVTLNLGLFLNAIINFLIVAAAVFAAVKGMQKLKRPQPQALPTVKDCPYCLMSVPIKATRCAHCTSELPNGGGTAA